MHSTKIHKVLPLLLLFLFRIQVDSYGVVDLIYEGRVHANKTPRYTKDSVVVSALNQEEEEEEWWKNRRTARKVRILPRDGVSVVLFFCACQIPRELLPKHIRGSTSRFSYDCCGICFVVPHP